MTVNIVLKDIKKIEADAVIVGFYEDERPLKGPAGELDWLLCGSLSHILISGRLTGAVGDVALFSSRSKIPADKIFLVGLGARKELTSDTLGMAAMHAARSAVGAGVRSAAIEWLPVPSVTAEESVPALISGLREGTSGRRLDVALVAPDAEVYERLSGIMKALGTKRSSE